ncbi:MAG TPA: UDP-N-acetylmuramate dehydrogenase [Candidatus Omnitrophota bacterium]|nr:UDP-N-acetylmuramate dehydrogenase [Candidatus Omnitrophota bacterium]
MKLLRDEPLDKHTTFRIGGPSKYFISPRTVGELKEALLFATKKRLKVFVLGMGSNVLADDRGFNGLVINPKLTSIKIEGTEVTVGAGVPLQHLLAIAAQNGLSGLEFLAGIPGSVGGALAMNAGAGKDEIGSKVISVRAVGRNGKERNCTRKQCRFGYRKSVFRNGGLIVTGVVLSLNKDRPSEIRKRIKERWKKRLASQPYELPSAGSVFKNPKGGYAGRLIEAAGLKGKQVGGARISEKHANFIVNSGHAKAKDVLNLMRATREKVNKMFRLKLEPEIILLK